MSIMVELDDMKLNFSDLIVVAFFVLLNLIDWELTS